MYKILFCIALAVALVCCYVLGWHLGYLCGVIDTQKERGADRGES